ncbi:MAG: hypothetical protein K8F91_01955, partial [Candidatus Obscuribacterales bacterium]|nr:hypothetical protein [Candidatus Obscuribacterales bacterium]
MLERWQRKLILSNIVVVLVVLSIFCLTVYWFGCSAYDQQLRDKLRSIADSAISSIDFDDYGESHNGKPDLIVSVLPDDASPSLSRMRLQWFDSKGVKDIEKGSLELFVPLLEREGFQFQDSPRALIFSKPAIAHGKLLGYVRVGHPLAELDEKKDFLLTCLLFGTLVAVSASALGVLVLVRLSMKPVHESMQRLKQFSADAAHELRTPITAIQTNSDVALRYPEGMRESDREKFEDIISGARQMEKLTTDLLSLAQAEQSSDSRSNRENVEPVRLKGAVNVGFDRIRA